MDFAGGYRPSADHERVGGDFYDVHPAAVEGEASLVTLGDVCGKGLEAAVLTGKIRNTLHALLPMADDHQRMISLLNTALLNSHTTRFATLVLASAVRKGSTVSLRLTSAGHPSPLILRSDGTVEEADTRGTLVGAIPDAVARTTGLTLAPGSPASCTPTVSPRRRAARWATRSSARNGSSVPCRNAWACRPRASWNGSRCSPPSGSARDTTTTWPSW